MKLKLVLCIILILVSFFGCKAKDKVGLTSEEDATPVSSVFVDEYYAQMINDKVPLHLYFGNGDGNSLTMEVRYIPLVEAKKSVQSLAGIIVRELLTGPTSQNGLKTIIPAGTKLNAEPAFKSGTITVNLNAEFAKNIESDPVKEKLAIFSIVNSLTEVKEIDRVKFLIDGKEKKDYKGKLKLEAVFPRNPTLINIATGKYTQQPVEDATLEVMEVLD